MDNQCKNIKERLLKGELVSRNWALQNYIGRLASRINDLKNEGLNIEGKRIPYINQVGKRCWDYEYFLIKGQQSLL